MSSKQDDDEYEKYRIQIGTAMDNQKYMIPPGAGVGGIGTYIDNSTAPWKTQQPMTYISSAGIPSSKMITDAPYFVMWYDTTTGVYNGLWAMTDEDAAEKAREKQGDSRCGQILILEKGQQWLKMWERR